MTTNPCKTRRHRRSTFLSATLALGMLVLLGCPEPESTPTLQRDDVGSGGGDVAAVDPDDPSLEVDPHVCATDEDCLVGTPRDCCSSSCPSDAVAWSRDAWAAYQDECAIVECAVIEDLACLPDARPPARARCVDARCVLVRAE
jgi:hypothetical protein